MWLHFGSFQLDRTRANSVVWKETKTAKNSYNVYIFSFGPEQSKWTIKLSWCEYTLKHMHVGKSKKKN